MLDRDRLAHPPRRTGGCIRFRQEPDTRTGVSSLDTPAMDILYPISADLTTPLSILGRSIGWFIAPARFGSLALQGRCNGGSRTMDFDWPSAGQGGFPPRSSFNTRLRSPALPCRTSRPRS